MQSAIGRRGRIVSVLPAILNTSLWSLASDTLYYSECMAVIPGPERAVTWSGLRDLKTRNLWCGNWKDLKARNLAMLGHTDYWKWVQTSLRVRMPDLHHRLDICEFSRSAGISQLRNAWTACKSSVPVPDLQRSSVSNSLCGPSNYITCLM